METQILSDSLHFQLSIKPERKRRIQQMLEYLENIERSICMERAKILTNVYRNTEHLPEIIRRAKALEEILKNMTIYILPESLLVSNQASRPKSSPLFPEFTVDFLEEEIIHKNPFPPSERPADSFQFDNSNIAELKEIIEWWKGKTFKEKTIENLPKEALLAQDVVQVINIVNFLHGGDGHFAPNYKWLFKNGLRKIIEVCQNNIDTCDLSEPGALDKVRFWKSALIVCNSLIKWAHRYAELAESMANLEDNETRKKELLEIARVCRVVPENPARSFYEALQFMAFVEIALQIEDNAQGICPGRFDQIMYPYYQYDIEAGKLTRETALELVQNFFILLSNVERIRSWEDTHYFRGQPIFQNLTIGGINPETGMDATNDVTYIVLDAIASTRTLQPSHYARWHKNAPEEYKIKVVETIRLGTGFPALANDELYIPSMINRGYSYQDASNYCIVGCAEPGVEGLRGGRTGGAWFSLIKVLELTLYNGQDPRTNCTIHSNCNDKDISSFSDFNELWEALTDQVKYYVRLSVIMDDIVDQLWEENLNEPLASVLGCSPTTIERGKPIKKGGAKYDFSGQQTIGLANVANSLYAIKYLIFDNKLITGKQLFHALRTNFSDLSTDPTGPEIKQMCLTVPKYGNDIDEVDFIARDILALVCEEYTKYKNPRFGRGPIGCIHQASTTTVSSNTAFGRYVGALPDGREAGVPLADGQSPMRGTDIKGPTAALKSVAKLQNILLSEGSLYNMKLLPADLKNDKGLQNLVNLIDYYFSIGGMQIQFNVVSKKTLLDAQKNPSKYQNLIVRVAGYSAYFVTLDKEVQNDIIERTEERIF